jgi:hypothetical protein
MNILKSKPHKSGKEADSIFLKVLKKTGLILLLLLCLYLFLFISGDFA